MKEVLTSRERVNTALQHREGDRFPIDLGMHFSTGISVFAYFKLREYLNLPVDSIQLADTVQMLARVDEDILDLFHCDTVILNPPYRRLRPWHIREHYRCLVPEQMNPTMEDGYYVVKRGTEKMRMPREGFFFDGSWIQIKDGTDDEYLLTLAHEAERIEKETDKFSCLQGEFTGFFTGIDMACDMLTDGDSVTAYNKKLLKTQREKFLRFVKNGGENIGCVEINSDLGMQNGPMLSPACYEEFVFPYLKEFIKIIHENSGAKVFLHCCGSIFTLIPWLIEAGVDILNPVQISADNMDPAALKKTFGERICFWGGGCNTQQILGGDDTEAVRKNTRDLCAIFKDGGGFVFNQVHNIMGNVAPQNIIAMFEEAYKASFYTRPDT
ncbi:MAG: hypothetical protein LBQ55_01870 [Treponema sp.]|jgi:uroporphyrinogen decarboxylase|nr:hypothetical protein [Treponema sp.]